MRAVTRALLLATALLAAAPVAPAHASCGEATPVCQLVCRRVPQAYPICTITR